MSSTPLAETEEDVFEAVPETQRLDSSLQKAKAQLSIKTRRHRPSRSRLRDSQSSTEGDDSFDGKGNSISTPNSSTPLHAFLSGSSPSVGAQRSSSPARRGGAFTLDPPPAVAEGRGREQRAGRCCHVLSTSSQAALLPAASGFSSQPCTRSENSSPAHVQVDQLYERDQRHHSQSEDDSHELGSDEPGSPTVLLDRKSRRSFLNLGVTLRRTYGRVRKDRSNRRSAGNRETERTETCASSRSSGPPFVPFSWFSDRLRCSSSPKASSQSAAKLLAECMSQSQDSGPSASHLEAPGRPECSQPYRSLGDPPGEEGCEDSGAAEAGFTKKKTILPFSTGGRDRGDKQNGVHGKRDGGNKEDGQKLLTT